VVPEVAGLGVPTVVSYTHPPGSAEAGPRLVDSLGGLWGAHPLGSVDGLQQTRVDGRRIQHCSICHIGVGFIIRGFHFHVLCGSSGGRIGVILKGG